MTPQSLESIIMQPRIINSINLGILIDFIIQKTYHELTVLAELLPRRTDMERKIEIYNFSARTRQLFVRLLALVKWASSASKVDTSAKIMSFLDKQSMLFVETADVLARISRDTLVHARLPSFHIPAAVEVLTTGTYGRLPAVIREKIVPPDPITPSEKRYTLNRLNQVIEHRLVTESLMPQLKKFFIKDGRVTFQVKNEFEVSLTLMGDSPNIPWRLLDIDILVEDKETGDGKALVHTLQVNYIHKLIQARLAENQNALVEVFNCLHYFCQSLQLEVLYQQTMRLARDRLADNIRVENYVPGNKLTVSYWRDLIETKTELGYQLTIQSDQYGTRPLTVIHVPSIGNKESEVARVIRSDSLSIERLLVHTVYLRSLMRLNDLKIEFQSFMKETDFHLQGTPAILTVPVLNPCLRAEQIHITVDTHTGNLHCHVPKHMDCPIIQEFQQAINSDYTTLKKLVSELRYWIAKRRCEKTLQHLPATLHEKIPLVYPPNHEIAKIGRNKTFIQLHRHPSVILIVQFKEKETSPNEIEFSFFLVNVKKVSYEDKLGFDNHSSVPLISSLDRMKKLFLTPISLIEFDTFVTTHGPGTSISDAHYTNKRKTLGIDGSSAKQQKTFYPAYFIPELAHVLATCDEKLPFVILAQELSKRKIAHSGLQVEANATSLVMKLLSLPEPLPIQQHPIPFVGQQIGATQLNSQPQLASVTGPDQIKFTPIIEKRVWNALLKRLLSVSIRAQFNKINQTRIWTVEYVFFGTPLPSSHGKEQGQRRAVYMQYEILSGDLVRKTVDCILNDWSKIVYLYCLVHDFADFYQKEKHHLQSIVTIKQYSYNNLLLAYGPNKQVNVNIYWCIEAKEFKMIFVGGNQAINGHSMMRDQMQSKENNAINAHSMMRDQLQIYLNRHYNLTQTVHLLHGTYSPLSSVAKLPIIPQLGILTHKMPVLTFCILPQSPNLLRLSFQGTYCLEIRLQSGMVSIRDGAYSRFDRSNVVEEFTPTPSLKGFLTKYVDETAVYRRRSHSEDDNPPSPMTIEHSESGPGSVGSSFLTSNNVRAPQSPRDAGLRFGAQHSLTPPSNPHTPASPHTGPVHPNFMNMTSPPGAGLIPHPSPGTGILPPSSPLNAQPSPMAHSPNPTNLCYTQNHTEGSPFTSLSPAASNWPGSPGISRPSPRPGQSPDQRIASGSYICSRTLPARSWAGAIPTLLTNDAFDQLCSPGPHPQKDISGPDLSPLERFLGCVFMRKQLQKLIQNEENLIFVASNEPGVVIFRVDGIQCQVYLNQIHMQSLHLKATHATYLQTHEQPCQFALDDLKTIEQYFEMRVAAPPYRSAALNGFTRMLNVPPQVLKDCIKLMRMEMFPEATVGQLKWNIQFCLRVPPPPSIIPIGMPAVVICRSKVLFYIRLTRANKDLYSLVLPIIFDFMSNSTQLAEKREQAQPMTMSAVGHHLRRFIDFFVQQHTECSFYPALRDLAANFTLPNEAQPTLLPQNQGNVSSQQLGNTTNQNSQTMGGSLNQLGPLMSPQTVANPLQQQQHHNHQQQQPHQQGYVVHGSLSN